MSWTNVCYNKIEIVCSLTNTQNWWKHLVTAPLAKLAEFHKTGQLIPVSQAFTQHAIVRAYITLHQWAHIYLFIVDKGHKAITNSFYGISDKMTYHMKVHTRFIIPAEIILHQLSGTKNHKQKK